MLLDSPIMKLCLFFLLSAAIAFSQNSNPAAPQKSADSGTVNAQQSKIRQQAAEALSREQSRSNSDLCAKSEAGGNASIGKCLSGETKVTDQDYFTYTRSISALLQFKSPGDSSKKSNKKTSFDMGEDAWLTYRSQSCDSVSTQWKGDQTAMAYATCMLTLTWNHMTELSGLYADLSH